MAHSLLMIPVPELDHVVRPRLERLNPGHVSTDPDETTAHITLLAPFADRDKIDDGLLAELRSIFSDVIPFEYKLSEITQFPDGTTYLAPVPSCPFRHLTHELFQRFPEFPPYGGAFDEVVPHLTIPTSDEDTIESRRFETGALPITAHAQEAALVWWEPGAIHTLETFRFGTTAA
ncbi:MAG: 2'-5' RNA ligase family protein [Actinomycetes bacterium]